jgi:hypothetical protein
MLFRIHGTLVRFALARTDVQSRRFDVETVRFVKSVRLFKSRPHFALGNGSLSRAHSMCSRSAAHMIFLKFLAPGAPLLLSVPSSAVAPIAEAIQLTSDGENESLINTNLFDEVMSLVQPQLQRSFNSFLHSRRFKELQLKLSAEKALGTIANIRE